ncbi:MAG: hypothetical protein HY076_09545, partial [Candidatus Eisenbacteria bacterium]|nr:hypothetical protein [Candidatus Eisenbacteria bacterium]
MKPLIRIGIPMLALALVAASGARAATTGTANVTLAATANAMVDVLDPTITLSPTATDYTNDYVEAAGASGLRVRVKTNSSTGLALLVRCADAVPQITLADLLVRTQTASPTGSTTMGSYAAITSSNQTLWSMTTAQQTWLTVTTDVRVQNLINYNDAITAGPTNYTNTLTY